MKYEKFLKIPLPPVPLPAPRYQDHYTAIQELGLSQASLDGTADECILIRSQMYQLFRASEKHTTASELNRDLDLFSLGAVRLARSLHNRRILHYRQLEDPQDRVKVDLPAQDDNTYRPSQSPPPEDPICSSENADLPISINNPLVLSDLARGRIKPLIFTEKELFPGRGRPAIDLYALLEGILYKFLTGIPWSELPKHYPSPGACNRCYLAWKRDGTLPSIMAILITLEIDMQYENEKQSESLFKFQYLEPEDSPEQD